MGKGIKIAESTNRDQKMSHKVQIEKFVVHVLTFFSGVYSAKVIVSQSKIFLSPARLKWDQPPFSFLFVHVKVTRLCERKGRLRK